MKYVISIAIVMGSMSAASAQYYGYGTGSNSNSNSVSGYTTNNGTYVQPHYRTNPNNTQLDNYGTSGNYNTFSGSTGSRRARY